MITVVNIIAIGMPGMPVIRIISPMEWRDIHHVRRHKHVNQ